MDENRDVPHEGFLADRGRHAVSRKQALKAGAAAIAGMSALPVLDAAGTAFASSPGHAAHATSVTISMWTHDILYVKFFTRRAKEWEKKYPQYHFTYNFVQVPYNDLFTKVLANLSAGTGAPDLVGIEINAFSRFMKGGIAAKGLVDLTPLIGAERDKFLRWSPYMYKGRIYAKE